MTDCENGCGQHFHRCKQEEHDLLCSHKKVPCINSIYGCPVEMLRCKTAAHLRVCPASVQKCVVEWNRWPMHSKEDCIQTPLPLDSHNVKCTQLDVALALRDQRMLIESMKVPRKIRKIFQNSLTLRYPSVPLEQARSPSVEYDSCMSVDDTSGASSDDDSPWSSHKNPPGLQKTVVNQLHKASKDTADSVSAALDLFSHHFGRAGLKNLAQKLSGINEGEERSADQANTENSKHQGETTDNIETRKDQSNDHCINLSVAQDNQSHQTKAPLETVNNKEMMLEDVYTKQIKLFDLLGVSLDIECISKYIAKPTKMYTFLCAQDFRREEYPWHFKNVHNDIHCGLNGMLETRCPLAYMGCEFSCQKLSPVEPKGRIVHSSLQESFGLTLDDSEYENDKEEGIQCKNCDFAENDRRKLREATPEITTSQKYDSVIKILPKYRCNTICDTSISNLCNGDQLSISSLPFEVLQHIVINLDSFSLNNLSLTSKLFRDVCASLLDQKGMVIPVWQSNGRGGKPSWNIAFWKWCFSTSFTPVKRWEHLNANGLFEHLKVCPYNQEESKNIKTEPFCPAADFLPQHKQED